MSDTTFDPKLLCFISPSGEFQALAPLIALVRDEQLVFQANRPLLEGFGCQSDEQTKQGFDFLKSISLSSTFNSWANEEEGSSGISSKSLVASATTPGAILTLVGLLRSHPDASASGTLTVNYANPARRAGVGRPR
jgi:hypothetical protein